MGDQHLSVTPSTPTIIPPSADSPPRVILKERRARPFFAHHPWVFGNSIERIEKVEAPVSAKVAPVLPDNPVDVRYHDQEALSKGKRKVKKPNRRERRAEEADRKARLGPLHENPPVSASELAAGTEVAVYSHEGKFVARGLYNPASMIRTRLYRWDDAPLDEEFWLGRLRKALHLRRDILGYDAPGKGCRLVSSEADGLSGLIVDRYDQWLVVQMNSAALSVRSSWWWETLAREVGVAGILVRPDRSMLELEGLSGSGWEHGALVWGTAPEEPVLIEENGLTFAVDIEGGQKTGWYLDQRVNRRVAADYARGRTVLDLFCHQGGFSLNAVKHGGAVSARGIDSSSWAVAQARANAQRNHLPQADFLAGDVFETLAELRAKGVTYGMVVCDPPKFARSPKHREDAIKGYVKLNRAAVDVLAPDGILVTCSCSGSIEREVFLDILAHVAEWSNRDIQILESRTAAPDHPVSASCLESDYLKCVICRVS